MLRGDLPSPAQARLLEAALVAAVDHGPHAPSIAISRMAVTCGLPLNGAMASAINALDDIHGGAGQQCMELFAAIVDAPPATARRRRDVVDAALDALHRRARQDHSRLRPSLAPASIRARCGCSQLVARGAQRAGVDQRPLRAHRAGSIERLLHGARAAPIPMNIDGATAVIYSRARLRAAARARPVHPSRSVGILAHAWEQIAAGRPHQGTDAARAFPIATPARAAPLEPRRARRMAGAQSIEPGAP